MLFTASVRGQNADVGSSSQKLRKYENVIKQYRYSNPDSAAYFVKLGIELARQTGDKDGEAMMLNQSGMIDDNAGNFVESRTKYLQAQAIYQRTGNHKGEAAVTVRLGVVELRKGKYHEAIRYFLQSLKVSERNGNTAGVMEANVTLAEGYMGQKKYEVALKYLRKAESLNKDLPFSGLSLNILNNFGVIYRELGDFERSIGYLKKGISLSDVPQYHGLYITLTNNLASVYALQGFKKQSIGLQKDALNKARAIKNYLRELQCLNGLAASFGKQNPEEALTYLKQALDLASKKRAHKQAIEALGEMSDIYRHIGNPQVANTLKNRQYNLADSFFYRNMSRQIFNLQTEYELDKAKARVQQLEYEKTEQDFKRKIILSIAFAAVAIVIILGVFYFRTRELNARLNKINAELQNSNSVKDKLFSVLGHDLRTPFASTISYLQFLGADFLTDKERQEMAAKLEANCKVSLETLDALLKWGQMQLKGVRLNQTDFDAFEIIIRNIALFSQVAGDKSITIRNDIVSPVAIHADRDHFEFVFRNLLSNAIKFTPEYGTVSISATATAEGMVNVSVKDNGVGIAPDRIDQIFNLSNVSTSGTKDEKGTSLGLVISKEFMEANRGNIAVKSKETEGSEFIVTLHQAAAPVNRQEVPEPPVIF
ncbi:MAG TPA: tetratricopeptide repeat protein [Sphingobacteriaceae bacterium]